MKKVLVYGSLREGMYNYEAFKRSYPEMKKLKTTTVKGFDLYSLGVYPGVGFSKDTQKELVVDLLEMSKEAYNDIYRMEIGAGYSEIDITLEDGTKAPLYLYNYTDDVPSSRIVESGDWVKFMNKGKSVSFEKVTGE